ncbi:unnamed protein product [Owenia fusiformis]|uniref:Uncharacterized protein n=1 Tax=Owenia fusiformis TaxID=6347 RepID=A0A8J1Y409_OWEFU|nr:unnamed protein product [Owenia fusiformis]
MISVFKATQECEERVTPPPNWQKGRPYYCRRAFDTQEALKIHIACAHTPSERCGVFGCRASFCPNEAEALQLHRLRGHVYSPVGGTEPCRKRPRTLVRTIKVETDTDGSTPALPAPGVAVEKEKADQSCQASPAFSGSTDTAPETQQLEDSHARVQDWLDGLEGRLKDERDSSSFRWSVGTLESLDFSLGV